MANGPVNRMWLALAPFLLISSGTLRVAAQDSRAILTSQTASTYRQDLNLDAALLNAFESSEAGELNELIELRKVTSNAGLRSVIDVRLAAARLDLPAASAALSRAQRNHVPLKWLAVALANRAGASFATGNYALAAKDAQEWLGIARGIDPIHKSSDIVQLEQISQRLASLPNQRVVRWQAGSVPTWRDKATLLRTNVYINRKQQEVVLDTGANLSVVSETTAKKLGFEISDGGAVRSSTRSSVPVRLAIAHHMDIAGTALSNVAFLVLNDADLTFPIPGGYEIPAIVGFPVLRALDRITISKTSLVISRGARRPSTSANLVANGSDLFAIARVNSIEAPLHLDSGASASTLGRRFAKEHPAMVAGLDAKATRTAGAGGVSEGTANSLRDVVIEIDSIPTNLSFMEVAAPSGADSLEKYGTLGQDVLRSTGTYVIDFGALTLSLGPPEANEL